MESRADSRKGGGARGEIRFRPPRAPETPALAWVLRRAFAPPESESPALPAGAGDPAGESPGREAGRLAARLGLAPRVASRLGRRLLEAELGEEGAAPLLEARRRAAITGLAWDRVAADVARAAPFPIVFLKGYALVRGGYAPPEARPAGDLDVLAPAGRARELAAALEEAGFVSAGTREMEHQLPPLSHPGGGVVEVHHVVLGVRPDGWEGSPSATLEDLREAGLLAPLESDAEGGSGCYLPTRAALAAHALVHGIAQHGWAPHAYPAMKMMADLVDLGFGEDRELARSLLPWVRPALRSGEVEAARRLAAALARGEVLGEGGLLAAGPGASAEAALLHHLVAGALDVEYRESLRFAMLTRPLSDRSRPAALLRSLADAVSPGAKEMEILAGRGSGASGAGSAGRAEKGGASAKKPGAPTRLARRLLRPFRLLLRGLRYARRLLSVRRRRD